MRRILRLMSAMLLAASLASGARAETITAGAVGSASASHWMIYVAIDRGFFARRGITMDLVHAPSNAAVVQQLAAGSLAVTYSSGLVDPIRAVAGGAPVALVRIDQQASPYALLSKPDLPNLAALKGHSVIVGGAKDITRLYAQRMLASAGVGPGDVDWIYSGATSARMAALASGAVDAALLAPPFIFQARTGHFRDLGYAVSFAHDIPFSGSTVNIAWAKGHMEVLQRYLAAYTEAVLWFDQDANKEEAVRILVQATHADPNEAAQSYDLFRQLDMFDRKGTLAPAQLQPLVDVMIKSGDLPAGFDAKRLVLPGLSTP
jgi:ABC-type nitrate/sulfonate/bicarbonate transport system substrate-binding protein